MHTVDATTEQMIRSVLAYAENRLRLDPVPLDHGSQDPATLDAVTRGLLAGYLGGDGGQREFGASDRVAYPGHPAGRGRRRCQGGDPVTSQTEQQLRDLFAFDASRVPTADGLADAARQRVRRRRRRRLAWAAGVAAVLVGTGGAISLTAGWLSPQASTSPGAARSAPGRVGALPDGVEASCVESYSPTAVSRRAFAFDGTVVEIGPARTNRAGAELPLVAVTFHVNQWFHGGSSPSATVDMTQPFPDGVRAPIDEAAPSYGVGTRLLVSGEPRWGGAPLDDPIAWGCGFTRYHDTDTAGLWRDTAK